MTYTEENNTYNGVNRISHLDYIWVVFINDIPYLLKGFDDILVWEVPRVLLLHNPPKYGREEVLMPTILGMSAIGEVFVV